MEFYAYTFSSSSSSSSSSISSRPPSSSAATITFFLVLCQSTCKQWTVKSVTGNIISVIVSLFLGIVGTLLGGINGAIIGNQSENSYFRGAVVGAISGSLLSLEVFESFLRLWSSDGKGVQCFLYLGDVLVSLVNGKLVRERVDPILTVNRRPSQSAHIIIEDVFENSTVTRGLSMDMVEKIPRVEITSENHADSCRLNSSCSVCLEDFQVSDEARTLPYCKHMFHSSCIDQWLIKCGWCPLCRRSI